MIPKGTSAHLVVFTRVDGVKYRLAVEDCEVVFEGDSTTIVVEVSGFPFTKKREAE